jgi:predicted small secreted protein
MAARWPTTVTLNLYQLSAVLAAVNAGRGRDRDLQAALRKLARAAERRRKAVERAGGGR